MKNHPKDMNHDHCHCGCHGEHEHTVVPSLSARETELLPCPHCHQEMSVELVSVLHPGDKELKELFAGTLNRPTCPKCGKSFHVSRTLTYCEEEPPFIVYQMPEPEEGDTREFETEVDAMATEVFREKNLPRPTVRLTFERPDFLEKIAIRRLGFDDRIIEFAKLQLYRSMDEQQLNRTFHRLLLDYSHCDEEHLSFFIFDREKLQPVNLLQVPMKEFHALESAVQQEPDVANELDAAFPGCVVSSERLL